MRVFIGWDDRETQACLVANSSLQRANSRMRPEFLRLANLRARGLFERPIDRRSSGIYDLASNAPWSTEFAVTRFLVPILCQSGWALFTDCDVVFLRDVEEMLLEADPTKAVMVVKHLQVPTERTKMDDQPQTRYDRKNWSSVMLFNCDHPANRRLRLRDVSERPGIDLHQFYWLHDSEIGELDPAWNWLVNVQPRPDNVGIAHFTLGGPWIPSWAGWPNDEIWLDAKRLAG